MWADEEIALIVVFANMFSAVWSYFSIVSSVDPLSSGYTFMHQELAWYALWYSCQTYAFLVSLTNVALVVYIVYRVKSGFLEKVKVVSRKGVRVVMRLMGMGVVLGMVGLCFVPFKMTMIRVERVEGGGRV
ncbi:hypothetical protein BDD12DRAFT_896335 [Trichophaea hybrida]|nr:hypothetical protein BDD12DRAFT_896335 [Trichophaea hybrida]